MNSVNIVLNRFSLALLVLTGFLFPIFILPISTDPFTLPKQGLVLGVVLLALLISGLKLLAGQELKFRRTPYDLPILGFSLVLVISSLLSANRADSIIFSITILSLVLFYYVLVNLLRGESEATLFTVALVVGSALSAIVLILSRAEIYFLSFLFHPAQLGLVQNQAFNSLGSLLVSAIFLLLLIPVGAGLASVNVRKNMVVTAVSLISTLVIALAFLLSVYQLFTTQKPILLPYEYGLQAATGAIGLNFKDLLFGSGPGTFLTDFSRFRSAIFNSLPFWNNIFFSSSSLFLELLATTGLLGITFFLLLIISIFKSFNPARAGADRAYIGLFVSLVLAVFVSFIVPIGFIILFLLFSILAIYTVYLSKVAPKTVFDTKILVVNLQEGLGVTTNILSFLFIAITIIVSLVGFYLGGRFLLADSKFQKSLITASENKGLDTYNLQREAIAISPYRDGFYRVFSQTNLALATGISQDLRNRNASPSAQEQQTILTLVQQSITNARSATNLGPQNFLNWDNLAAIYRALIGFGQDAENFSIVSLQQAIALNPVNPQLYLGLGGAYFQLGQWEQAQRQFEVAVRLKPDFANSYYNLGHALENKGNLQGALVQYQTVEALLSRDAKDSDGHKRIKEEIEALKARISREGATVAAAPPPQAPIPPTAGQAVTQEQLRVSTPSSTLPKQGTKVEIPPPTTATESAR